MLAMKKKFYDVGTLLYLRNQKCGAGVLTALAVGTAVAGTGVKVYDSISKKNATDWANEQNIQLSRESLAQQKELFNKGNEFNRVEAEKARAFNAAEAEKSRVFSAEQSENQFKRASDWFEKYASPAAQVQQYIDAGLNPAGLAGNVNGYSPSFSLPSASPASGPAASASAFPNVSTPAVQPSPFELGDIFGSVADTAQKIFGVGNSSEDYKGKVTDNEIRKAANEANLELTNETIKRVRKDCEKIDADINLINKNVDKIGEDIKLIGDTRANIDADTAIKNLDLWFKGEEYQQLLKKMEQDFHISRQLADANLKLLASQVFKNRADASSAYAMAQYYKVAADVKDKEERKSLDAYKKLLNQQEGIAATQNFLDTLFGTKDREYKQKISAELYEKARYQNTTLFNLISAGKDVTGSLGSLFLTVYGGKGMIE